MNRTRFPTFVLMALTVFVLSVASAHAALKPQAPRRVVELDGIWQVGRGNMETAPAEFDHTVTVPGLLDMADLAFQAVGRKSPKRQAFWYRRTFTLDGAAPEVALLKFHKAKYGLKIRLK